MRSILELFIDPEGCAKEILNTKGSRNIPDAMASIAKIVVLIGCMMGLMLKLSMPQILNDMTEMFKNLPKESMNIIMQIKGLSPNELGLFAVILTFFIIIFLFVGSLLSALIMAALLFLIKLVMGGKGTFKQHFTVTLYSQVIYNAVFLIGTGCTLFALWTMATSLLTSIILIVSFFQLWYLVFITVGFKEVNNLGLFKSLVAMFIMEGILISVYLYLTPGLGAMVGTL